MITLGVLLLCRVIAAASGKPDAAGWLTAGGLLLALAAVALPLGLRTGFLRRENAPVSPGRAAWMALVTFITPALAEEIVFRVLPLPHPQEAASLTTVLSGSGFSLAMFIAYHPLRVWLLPAKRPMPFAHPVFLLLTTLIGVCCTAAYLRTGSVWAPVLIHWLYVLAWLFLLGGYRRMLRLPA